MHGSKVGSSLKLFPQESIGKPPWWTHKKYKKREVYLDTRFWINKEEMFCKVLLDLVADNSWTGTQQLRTKLVTSFTTFFPFFFCSYYTRCVLIFIRWVVFQHIRWWHLLVLLVLWILFGWVAVLSPRFSSSASFIPFVLYFPRLYILSPESVILREHESPSKMSLQSIK